MKPTSILSAFVTVLAAALIGLAPTASRAADYAPDSTNGSPSNSPSGYQSDSPSESPSNSPSEYRTDSPVDYSSDSKRDSAPGSSMDKPSSYVMLKGGIYSPSNSVDVSNIDFGHKTGYSGEIAVGHYFLPMVAVELGAGYFQKKNSPFAPAGDTMLRVVPLIATGKVLVPLGIFEPYGLFGIGAYISDIAVRGNINNLNSSTEVTFGLHAGAGFNINLHDNMFVGLEGKYLWAEPSFRGGSHIKLDGFLTTADIGFRF